MRTLIACPPILSDSAWANDKAVCPTDPAQARRRRDQPKPAKPSAISEKVAGSGTVCVSKLSKTPENPPVLPTLVISNLSSVNAAKAAGLK